MVRYCIMAWNISRFWHDGNAIPAPHFLPVVSKEAEEGERDGQYNLVARPATTGPKNHATLQG